MRHYLDGNAVGGILIEEPSGSAGVYFEKVRSRRFWGMLRNNIGRVRGIGEILFEEPLAIQILQSAYDKNGVDASVKYQMVDDTGTVLIDSEINFSNVRWRREGWSVTLRDTGTVETLDLQADTLAEIAPTQEVTLETVALAQEKTHTINPTLKRVAWNVNGLNKTLAHYPAWEAESTRANATGDFATVTNVNQEQCVWRNTTGGERRLQITGRLVMSHRSATASNGMVVVYVINGNEVLSYPTTSVVVTSTLETATYAINQILNIPSGGELYIQLKDFDANSSDFEFNYDTTASYLCVNQDVAIAESTAKVIPVIKALEATSKKIATELTIVNQVEALGEDWITNGLQLRGVSTANLKVSFGGLWDDLNKIYCLILARKSNDEIEIKDRSAFLSDLGSGVVMRDVSTYEFLPNTDLLASRVMVGYNRWQSYTPTGREEVYGAEDYTTGLKKIDRILDLVCTDLVAAVKLRESVRRLQFNWGGSRNDKDEAEDERLFIKGTDITPKANLRRWSSFWAASSTILTKTSGMPDSSAHIEEATSDFFTGKMARVEGVMTGAEWAALGDVLTFYDGGQSWRILVMMAMYRPGAAGSGQEANTMVEGWVLK